MKHVYLSIAWYWQQTYLPLHFTRAAYYRYPDTYRQRSRAYFLRHHVPSGTPREDRQNAVAAARAKHQPNVFTGTLRELSQHMSGRAFNNRAVLTMPLPPYIVKQPKTDRVNTLEELHATNSQETGFLQKLGTEVLGKSINDYVETRTLPPIDSQGNVSASLAAIAA